MEDGASEGLATISELARMRGVDKAAISRRVKRFEVLGMLASVTRNGRKYVNVADFDRVCGETTDPVRAANGRSGKGDDAGNPILAYEQTRLAKVNADLKTLELDRQIGALLALDDVREALQRAAETQAQVVDALPDQAEALAAAVAGGGVTALRAALKVTARKMREELATALALDGERLDVVAGVEATA